MGRYLGAGCAVEGAMGPFLGHGDLPAIDLEEHRAAAVGASTDREKERLAHVRTSDLLATFRSGSPAAKRAISSATMVTPRSRVS